MTLPVAQPTVELLELAELVVPDDGFAPFAPLGREHGDGAVDTLDGFARPAYLEPLYVQPHDGVGFPGQGRVEGGQRKRIVEAGGEILRGRASGRGAHEEDQEPRNCFA
jgi:hypothetical protein